MSKFLSNLVPLLLTAGLCAGGPARADVVGGVLDDVFDSSEEIQEFGDSVQDAFSTYLSQDEGGLSTPKKGGARGAEGALMELASNSGELICGAWVISFRLHIRNMTIENLDLSGQDQIDHLELIRQAQEFADIIEAECERAGFLQEYDPDDIAGGGGGAGEVSDEPPEMDPAPVADKLNRREGETVADAICRHRCQRYLDAMNNWQRWLDESEEDLGPAETELVNARAHLSGLEQTVSNLQNELGHLRRVVQAGYDGNWSEERKQNWLNAERRSRTLPRTIDALLDDVAEAQARVQNAELRLENERSNNAYLRRRVEQARREYERCLSHCLTQAADAGDPTTIICPEPAGHKSVTVGPNDKVGSSAQLGQDIKKTFGGGAGLGGLLGGGGTLGGNKSNPVPNRAGGGKQPRTVDDPIEDGDKVTRTAGDTELETGAMLVGDGLLVSSHIADSPGDGTFQAVFLENGQGQRMTPDRYEIYEMWRDWSISVWWTYDRWVDGQHVEHREGGWTETGRETMPIAALQPGSAEREGIWNRLGFSSAAKGIQTLGAHFALRPEDLSEPVDLVIHTTLPEEDPVTTQPVIYRLSLENGSEIRLDPVTTTLAQARNCY